MSCYNKGEVVLRVEPYVRGLNSYSKGNRCDFCFSLNKFVTLNPCKGCNKMNYCSSACADSDWEEGHEYECEPKFLKQVEEVVDDPPIRVSKCQLVFRFFLKLYGPKGDIDRDIRLPDGSAKTWQEFLQNEFIQSIELDAGRKATCGKLLNIILSIPSTREIFEAKGMNAEHINSLFKLVYWKSLMLGNYFLAERFAECFYSELLAVDHRCTPTAGHVFEGSTLVIRSLEDGITFQEASIDYLNGRGYVEPLRNYYSLLASRYIYCECTLCKEPGQGSSKLDPRSGGRKRRRSNEMIHWFEMHSLMYEESRTSKEFMLIEVPMFLEDCKKHFQQNYHPLMTNALIRLLIAEVELKRYEEALKTVQRLLDCMPITHGPDNELLVKLKDFEDLLQDSSRDKENILEVLNRIYPNRAYRWYKEIVDKSLKEQEGEGPSEARGGGGYFVEEDETNEERLGPRAFGPLCCS